MKRKKCTVCEKIWLKQYVLFSSNSLINSLLIFGFFVGPPPLAPPPLSYSDPSLINFPGFVLQIFQRLSLKWIVLFAKLLAV